MDPRHQSFKQGLLNELIGLINDYMHDHVDQLVQNEVLLIYLREICRLIYSYLDLKVDVEGILSRKNLLSIDMVLLPLATDPEAIKVLKDDDFFKLIEQLAYMQNNMPLLVTDSVLDDRIRAIFTRRSH